MKDCAEYQALISELLDGELTAEQTAGIQTHIAQCDDCRALYEAFSALSDALEPEEVPDTLHAGIMEKVALAEKAGRTQKTLVRLRPILAAAACLVVVVGTVFALKNGLGMAKPASPAMDGTEAPKMAFSAVAGAGAEMSTEEAPAASIEEPQEKFDADTANNGGGQNPAPDVADAAGENGSNVLTMESAPVPNPALALIVRVKEPTSDGFTAEVVVPDAAGIFAEGESITVRTADVRSPDCSEGAALNVWFYTYDRGNSSVDASELVPAD